MNKGSSVQFCSLGFQILDIDMHCKRTQQLFLLPGFCFFIVFTCVFALTKKKKIAENVSGETNIA